VFALLLVSLASLSTCAADGIAADVLWPKPQHMECQAASSPLPVSSAFTVKTDSTNATVLQLAAQYQSIIRAAVANPISASTARVATAKATLAGLQLTVKADATKPLDSYVVSFAGATTKAKGETDADVTQTVELTLTATSVRAAGYALETAAQLLEGGALNCSTLSLTDFPSLAVRELRVDAASRYIPLGALDSIVLGMQAAKLNVLTLHLADYAGVRAESGAYHALTDDMNGYYRHVRGWGMMERGKR
jgi:N-acetyl-beta-hexosaminidase